MRRKLTQGALAADTGVSTRYLSFIETGRRQQQPDQVGRPAGLARLIVNIEEWGASLVEQVRRRAESTCDEAVRDLYEEVARYPGISARTSGAAASRTPLILRCPDGGAAKELKFFVAATTFPMARDATVEELSVETFFPADENTRLYLIGKR